MWQSIWGVVLLGLVNTGANACPLYHPSEWREEVAALHNRSMQGADVVIVGSSTIRLSTLPIISADEFRAGFGGATLAAIAHNIPIIIPKNATVVGLYGGENDVGDGCDADTVLTRLKTVLGEIRATVPQATIVYIEMKPSIARWHLRAIMQEINRRVKEEILPQYPQVIHVPMWGVLLGPDGTPDPRFYVEDKLHLSLAGLKKFTGQIAAVLGHTITLREPI